MISYWPESGAFSPGLCVFRFISFCWLNPNVTTNGVVSAKNPLEFDEGFLEIVILKVFTHFHLWELPVKLTESSFRRQDCSEALF